MNLLGIITGKIGCPLTDIPRTLFPFLISMEKLGTIRA
jgi:hypothetical protein